MCHEKFGGWSFAVVAHAPQGSEMLYCSSQSGYLSYSSLAVEPSRKLQLVVSLILYYALLGKL